MNAYDGNPRTVREFLASLQCPHFSYDDVLYCHAHFAGEEWATKAKNLADSPSDDLTIPEDGLGDVRKQLREMIQRERQNLAPQRTVANSGKRIRVMWTAEETDCLMKGVRKFGVGNWKQIRDAYSAVFDANQRTSRDLRLRYRNVSGR